MTLSASGVERFVCIEAPHDKHALHAMYYISQKNTQKVWEEGQKYHRDIYLFFSMSQINVILEKIQSPSNVIENAV